MTLKFSPETVSAAPQTSFEEFLQVLDSLHLSPARVEIDIDNRHVIIDGIHLLLCHKEFQLLAHLVLHSDRAVSREELFNTVWQGSDLDAQSRTVDAHIRRLRAKLNVPDLISTVRGEGYRFNSSPEVRVQISRAHALVA
ncbi:winged helix-turn-helix domain-containing protein [Schaalia sp. lx-100]|uniref:winged helix-turn-helix domain-containing protein n=1 Tax=Schaalia sp. lx-100 TaxID=2899081 RepID=UPI001E545BAC|nr:winged helix-turn-helix domain-containing protein [Schaalia sp. lx-100]MCD4558195.1 winged helix-turn-helix domain-containing protein [Schaalia sp. lx-100]